MAGHGEGHVQASCCVPEHIRARGRGAGRLFFGQGIESRVTLPAGHRIPRKQTFQNEDSGGSGRMGWTRWAVGMVPGKDFRLQRRGAGGRGAVLEAGYLEGRPHQE